MDDQHQLLNHEKHELLDHQKGAGAPEPRKPEPLGMEHLDTARASGRAPEPPALPLPHPDVCRQCLAAMTHRLAQPITALRGGLELALMGQRSAADYQRLLEQSMQLADDMAQLIISLRDLGESRARSGSAQPIRLNATTAEILAELETLAQLRGLRLEMQAERDVEVCANPERLREALQSLLAWIIQNSAGEGSVRLEISAVEGEARLLLSPPRMDLQYLQIKVLEDTLNPGVLFSHASRNGALGWAISQRLVDTLGGKLEILTEGSEAGCMRVRFPLAAGEVGGSS